jgi:hypothetical protein
MPSGHYLVGFYVEESDAIPQLMDSQREGREGRGEMCRGKEITREKIERGEEKQLKKKNIQIGANT